MSRCVIITLWNDYFFVLAWCSWKTTLPTSVSPERFFSRVGLATFTSDWYLRKGESRDKMGEWLKKATVRSQDQRRMLQANTHRFPSNYFRNKITKGKESNKCDLCRDLWTTEGRFNWEEELPTQTLGHIQHQCGALSEIHALAYHRCWCIIHAESGRLTSTKWWFICINGEKTLKTIWNELEAEFPAIFNNCSVQIL